MKKLVILGVVALMAGSASAVTVQLHSSNLGIGYGTWSVSGTDINVWETWTANGMGVLEFNELETFQNYTVTKYITNNTGNDWFSIENELLDPSGDQEDIDYDIVPLPWVPAGFSHSNDMDGLSFAQGSGIPRTSTAFSSVFVDEMGGRDFLDFYSGFVSGAGGEDTLSFGLRDNDYNQPFLLVQNPNFFLGQPIPEPTTMILFGLGLAGVAVRNRFKK